MKLLKDLLDQMKGYILPRSASERTAPSYDGQYDPLGDEELLTIEKRGSFLKDTNGKLYYPTTDGYLREKNLQAYMANPSAITTTDDTAVAIASINLTATTPCVGQHILSAYQISGGPLVLTVYADAGKTQVLDTNTVQTGVGTLLNIRTVQVGDVYVAWSAAAGGTQYVLRQKINITKIAVV